MAAILPNGTRFIHVPKTGGTFVAVILQKLFPNLQFSTGTHLAHLTLSQMPGTGGFTFAFVRDPLDWYRSFWAYRMGTQRWNAGFHLDCMQSQTFDGFIRNVAESFQSVGFLSWYYPQFVGLPGDSAVHFIGRFENLRADLHTALDMAGIVHDTALIEQAPVHGASDSKWKREAVYSPEMADHIRKTERDIIERFGY